MPRYSSYMENETIDYDTYNVSSSIDINKPFYVCKEKNINRILLKYGTFQFLEINLTLDIMT
jgi:hypothetical protein